MEISLRARVRAGDPDAFGQLFDSSSLVYRGTTVAALLGVGVADRAGEVPAG
ncbi:hypothetical protein [Streptomyces hokutonensis]|uniref:hypothetical protein n=1 Tax=Streptomyces hokutonensis TaxID=1306990 RepID=UPI0033CCAACD